MVAVNGMEWDVQAFDADFMERFEAAVNQLNQDKDGVPNDSVSASIRYQCARMRAFFDGIFGQGAGNEAIPKDNLETATDAVERVIQAVVEQREAYQARLARYQPNRAQRRAK